MMTTLLLENDIEEQDGGDDDNDDNDNDGGDDDDNGGDDDDDGDDDLGGGVGCGALLGAHCLALLLIHSGTDLEHLEFFPSKYDVEVGDDQDDDDLKVPVH